MCTFVCIFMACMESIWLHIKTTVVHLAHLCTMTWSVDNVIAEIKDVGQLLHFKRHNGASNMEHLEATLIKNITYKLETMFLSPTQALSLQKALHEDVNLTPDMKAIVNTAIDASLTRDSSNQESAHGPKPQKINVSPYLTMSDWDIIKNSQNYHSKVAAVCKRLRSLGVRSLAEQSVKHAVGAILSGYKEMPDQSIMYQMVQDIKLGFVSHPMVHTGPVVVKYPEDPTKLPGQLYSQSYPNEHPAQIIPDKLPMILKLIPLRLTHAAIAKAKSAQSAPSGGSPGAPPLSSQGAFAPLVDVANSLATLVKDLSRKPSSEELHLTMNPNAVPGQPAASSAELESFRPKLRNGSAAGADMSSKPAASSAAAPLALEDGHLNQPDGANSLDGASIEQAAFDALLSRPANQGKGKGKGNGKGKGKAKAKAKAKSQPKGKAKAKACLKRPAACMVAFVYEPGQPGDEWAKRTLESWSSKHYHSARQMALNQGYSDEDAKSYARDARKRSVANWHNKFNN